MLHVPLLMLGPCPCQQDLPFSLSPMELVGPWGEMFLGSEHPLFPRQQHGAREGES